MVEASILAGNAELTRQAAELLDTSTLLQVTLDMQRGSLTLLTDSASVRMATADTAGAREILSMVGLEPVTLLCKEVSGKLVVVARSTTWSYRVVGILSSFEGVSS